MASLLTQTFAQNMKERRLALGLTQEQLAEAIGSTKQYIYRLESAVSDPTLQTVEKVSEGLRCEPHQLIVIKDVSPPTLESIVTILDSLSSSLKSIIRK